MRWLFRIKSLSIMYSSFVVIFGAWVLCIAIGRGGHCDTITFNPGTSYSWIIPPRNQYNEPSSPPHEEGPSDTFDSRNDSPITHIGGYGHPPFYLRHSHEQLSLPNEFLITPGVPRVEGGGGVRGFSPMPIFKQLDPVDCDGGPTCPNVDITQQQQRPTTIHQSNIASVPSAITPPDDYHQQQRSKPSPASLGQPVNWPSSHVGGIGLLFFVPESASHLPVQQLIRQQLALHRTQFPFDISINCEDVVGSGCRPSGAVDGGLSLPLPPPSPALAITLNERNAENGNYASRPPVGIDNSSSERRSSQQQRRKWRTITERLHQNRFEQKQQQLQQNQQEYQQNHIP